VIKGLQDQRELRVKLKTHPTGKLVMAAWSLVCHRFPPTLGSKAAFQSVCAITGRRRTGESMGLHVWWFRPY